MSSRRGLTLIEIAFALGIGLLVVIGAFSAVDAASKVIGATRRDALEQALVSAVLGHLRRTPADVATPPGIPASGEADVTASLFGIASDSWPEDWPRVQVERIHRESLPGGAVNETYVVRLAFADGARRPAIVAPVRRLP